MKATVVVTTYNEANTITKLINTLLGQSLKPNEIIIVDAGSSDGTQKLIKQKQAQDKSIKLIIKKNCSRSEGRNIGIKASKNKIIAVTDAGCWPKADWLEKITLPFKHKKTQVVAGFYKMVGDSSFQKALAPYLGIMPSKRTEHFLPSARSIALRRGVLNGVGGFPTNLKGTGEDTLLNYTLIKKGVKISQAPGAIVYWSVPNSLRQAARKFYGYAKGDAQTKIWCHPAKQVMSHNIKITLIYIRYMLGLLVLSASIIYPILLPVTMAVVIIYFSWSFYKSHKITKNIYSGLWGIVIQITSDFIVMLGFAAGTIASPQTSS